MNHPVIEKSLATTFEVTDRYDELDDDTADTSTLNNDLYESSVAIHTTKYTQVLEGWFKAPADGRYRFYMSCDTMCWLEFDETNYYGSGNDIDLQ